MALRYLLDTNICIIIRRQRPPQVRERLARQRPDRVGSPIPILGEQFLPLIASYKITCHKT